MPTLVIRGPDGATTEQPFDAELTIGRADNNDLVLSAGGVSRRHARIFVADGQVMVEDSGSANGTFLEGRKLARATALTGAAKVQIGDYELSLKAGARPPSAKKPAVVRPGPGLGTSGAPPTRTLARSNKPKTDAALLSGDRPKREPRRRPAASEAAVEGPQLRGLTGPWAGQVFPLEAVVLVGRVAGVTLQLDDDSVSRRHAEVEVTPEGVVLRDLGSANGTAVNGAAVSGEVVLVPGDIVQFGVVELEFQDRAVPAAARAQAAASPGAPRSRRLLVIVAAAVVALFGGGFLLKWKQGRTPPAPVVKAPSERDQQLQLLALISECRSYTSTDMGSEPQWDKAEASCERALDIDPINPEAVELKKRIKFEQENFLAYQEAERAMRLDREEEALEGYARIADGSMYFLRVKARINDAIDATMKKTREDCDRYIRNGELRAAFPRCEKYMSFRCQEMSREELYPPPGHSVVLTDGGRLRRNEWRPPDPMYRKFLRVRQRVDPGAPRWDCPVMKIIRPKEKEVSPSLIVSQELAKRFTDRTMQAAMLAYWEGRDNQANTLFLRVQEDMNKAALHRQSEELRRDAAAVASLFKAGQTALQRDDVDEAAKVFDEAVQLDGKLMGDMAELRPSEWRKQIGADYAEKAYEKGRFWADRSQFDRACTIWKSGFRFYKGNPRINKAIGTCSNIALQRFSEAGGCADLAAVLTFAVTGDGMDQKVTEKKTEWGCN